MIYGGIIAAGHGQRLKNAFNSKPKPLIEVAGKPLLARTLEQFRSAGIKKIIIIFRKSITEPCSNLLFSKFNDMDFNIISRDTNTSCESFISLFERIKPEDKLLITTVDSIFSDKALKKFLERAFEKKDENAIYLGTTKFIDDEKPLYVSVNGNDLIYAIGTEVTDTITCGVYLMPAFLVKDECHEQFSALRKFLAHLLAIKTPMYSIDLGRVIDVDRPQDIKVAEKFLLENQKNLL